MRISQFFGLGRTQPTLDFVDVDTEGDVRVFVDPRALRLLHSEWADECVALIQSFFQTVMEAIRSGHDDDRAQELLGVLREPNETHLGLSAGRARGRGLGSGERALDVSSALRQSEAARSGLLEDLEDTILMIEGISSDIISDMTTNIIRAPLIRYTQSMAEFYGIPLIPEVNSGPLWDPGDRRWYSEFTPMPVGPDGKLLLVPKVIVRTRMDYDPDEYYRHYLLEHLRDVELAAGTELVYLLKDGTPRVDKKDLIDKYGAGKAAIVEQTRQHPVVLQTYRTDKRRHIRPPLNHDQLAESEGTPRPDWHALLEAIAAIATGRAGADAYEKAIEALLSALLYPSLTNPQVQTPIHQGRKRVDITYTNAATEGFFYWLGQHYPSAKVFVECKNYEGDPANEALDKLSGRFSPSRGQFGILVCRTLADKELLIQRCLDTANDHRGYIVPLDDCDLHALVEEQMAGRSADFALFRERFDRLIM